MPGRLVEGGGDARMHVARRAASPFPAARDQVALDVALGAEGDDDAAVAILRVARHEDADALLEPGAHVRRVVADLREVRRADLLLAFRDEHEVDGGLIAGPEDGVRRGGEGGQRRTT